MKNSKEIRNGFTQYFAERDHTIVESSSLVPADDQTLLFTNAGMVQFKDIFLGQKKAPYLRATSSQRCIRVGGKHNDLENVGYTARHHTFFEMLGNFSFGDYFKREAIAYCWEFIRQNLNLPTERLWVTVYEEDDESVEFWAKDAGVARDRILRLGKADNFWSIGDIGPCGPCTEVYYDHGEGVSGGLPGSDDEGDRYTEIWNLVFMQYQRNGDEMTKLRAPSVDTGMGLERISAVMQGVTNNYDTDLFQPLIRATADLSGADDQSASLRIIADHVRACAFLIADDVHPDNEGRGYVLRRIIRRAARHGNKIGLRDPFMHSLLDVLMQTMGEDFPRLAQASDRIRDTLTAEEKRFADTLEQGLAILENCLSDLSGDKIPGDVAFKLYDTYGFPVDLTSDIARENGLQVDLPAFEACMREQRDRTRSAKSFAMSEDALLTGDDATEFSGYEHYDGATEVERIIADGREVESAATGEDVVVILQRTPFYAESGGQVGDTGELVGVDGENVVVRVKDTLKQSDVHKHCGTVERGVLKAGMKLNARVDAARRRSICLNHSATHLLHAALRKRLGEHVTQKGSLVAADRLRFDFSHDKPLTREEIRDIENEVNEQIRRNNAAAIEIMPREQALNSGAMSLFGEKYGDEVRVLSFGDYSVELCGGTHVERTGDIGLFHIVLETGIAMGVRRIEAVTGHCAEERVNEYRALLQDACDALKSEPDRLLARIEQMARNKADLEKRVDEYQARLSSGDGGLADQIVRVDDCAVLAARIDNIDRKALRAAVDQWRDRIKSGVIVLAAVNDDKINLAAGVTADYVERIHAGKLVNAVAELIGGKGGGRNPAMAEAGGKDIDALDAALKQVPDRVREQMADAPPA